MPAKSNLGGIFRLLHVLAGIAFLAWGLFAFSDGWPRILLPILGGYLLFEGLIGFSAIAWIFGKRGEEIE